MGLRDFLAVTPLSTYSKTIDILSRILESIILVCSNHRTPLSWTLVGAASRNFYFFYYKIASTVTAVLSLRLFAKLSAVPETSDKAHPREAQTTTLIHRLEW